MASLRRDILMLVLGAVIGTGTGEFIRYFAGAKTDQRKEAAAERTALRSDINADLDRLQQNRKRLLDFLEYGFARDSALGRMQAYWTAFEPLDSAEQVRIVRLTRAYDSLTAVHYLAVREGGHQFGLAAGAILVSWGLDVPRRDDEWRSLLALDTALTQASVVLRRRLD